MLVTYQNTQAADNNRSVDAHPSVSFSLCPWELLGMCFSCCFGGKLRIVTSPHPFPPLDLRSHMITSHDPTANKNRRHTGTGDAPTFAMVTASCG